MSGPRALFLLLVAAIWLFADAHIFVYHRFGDDRYPSTNTSIAELKREFEYLKRAGYRVVKMKTLVEALKRGKDIPDDWVVLTIDDGYKSFYEKGLEIFKEYNYPFTLFVATKPTEKGYGDYMSWQQINDCSQYGEIGLHSHAHPHLTRLNRDQIEQDTKKGIELFKKRLGFYPEYYAYPYGEYDDRVKKIIKGFGFRAIFNQNSGAVAKESDIFDLDRTALVGKSDIARKLKLKYLKASWIEPKEYPKDSILKRIRIKIYEESPYAHIYVTDYGWKKVKVSEGKIEFNPGFKLKRERVRLIVKVKDSKINTKILVK